MSKVATERKTATLGVIGLRTDRKSTPSTIRAAGDAYFWVETENELGGEESFNNIAVLREIGQSVNRGSTEVVN